MKRWIFYLHIYIYIYKLYNVILIDRQAGNRFSNRIDLIDLQLVSLTQHIEILITSATRKGK